MLAPISHGRRYPFRVEGALGTEGSSRAIAKAVEIASAAVGAGLRARVAPRSLVRPARRPASRNRRARPSTAATFAGAFLGRSYRHLVDLEDMIEAIANIVRAFPADRARTRPAVPRARAARTARPLGRHGVVDLRVRCEPARSPSRSTPRSAPPTPTCASATCPASPRNRAPAATAIPGHVMRFRKERSFVYPLRGRPATSSPRRRWRRSRTPRSRSARRRSSASSSRPPPAFFEELARRRYRRHENRLVRQERWGLPEGGLTSTLNRAEMTSAAAHPEPQPVLARGRRRRRHARDLQAARRRRAGPPRREPPAPPLDDRPPEPLPPPLPDRHPAAAPLAARARLGRRGRAPARAADRPHEGRPRPPGRRSRGSRCRPRSCAPTSRRRSPCHPPSTPTRRPEPPGPSRTAGHDRRPTSRTRGLPAGHRPLPYPLLPVLRASNGAGLIHPDDRKYGTLLVGSQGSGKIGGAAQDIPQRPADRRRRRRRARPQERAQPAVPASSRRPTAPSASGSSTSATRCSA